MSARDDVRERYSDETEDLRRETEMLDALDRDRRERRHEELWWDLRLRQDERAV